MVAGCQVTKWQAWLGLDNQLTLIKLPLIELLAMTFHTESGSVASRLKPFGIKLWLSDCISNPKACLTAGLFGRCSHNTWFPWIIKHRFYRSIHPGWPLQDKISWGVYKMWRGINAWASYKERWEHGALLSFPFFLLYGKYCESGAFQDSMQSPTGPDFQRFLASCLPVYMMSTSY